MPTFRLVCKVDSAGLEGSLLSAIARMRSMDAMLREWGDYGELEAKMAFAREATPGGSAWADLAASTWRQKSSSKKRWETGAAAGSYAARLLGGDSVEIASEGVHYEVYHHTGTSKMPGRRALPMPEYLRPKLAAIARKHLRDLLS